MRARVLVTALICFTLTLTGTGVAAADEPPPGPPDPTDGWVDSAPIEPDTDLELCGTTVTISFPPEGDFAEEWVTLDASGNTHIAFRGQLVADIEAADGRRAVLDISGPGETILLANGDAYFSARGETIVYAVTEAQRQAAADAGLPEAFYFTNAEAAVAIYTTAPPEGSPEDAEGTDTFTLLPDPEEIVDVCDLLLAP